MPPPVPPVIQDDSTVHYCNADHLPEAFGRTMNNQSFYHCPHRIELELNKVYEFLLIDDTLNEKVGHPFHMHGDAFQVIDMGNLDQLKNGETAFKNATHPPVIKDTVTVPKHGFVRIKFKASNPGYWVHHYFNSILIYNTFLKIIHTCVCCSYRLAFPLPRRISYCPRDDSHIKSR